MLHISSTSQTQLSLCGMQMCQEDSSGFCIEADAAYDRFDLAEQNIPHSSGLMWPLRKHCISLLAQPFVGYAAEFMLHQSCHASHILDASRALQLLKGLLC